MPPTSTRRLPWLLPLIIAAVSVLGAFLLVLGLTHLTDVSQIVTFLIALIGLGVASGANSALRELGGVFGVAVLASVFARPGVYPAPTAFTGGFQAALWAGAGFSAAGVLIAISVRRLPAPAGALGAARPEPATADAAD